MHPEANKKVKRAKYTAVQVANVLGVLCFAAATYNPSSNKHKEFVTLGLLFLAISILFKEPNRRDDD